MSKNVTTGRRWAIWLAALPALLSCIYAFSLGPAPTKYVFDFEHHQGSAEERRAVLEAGGPEALEVLSRAVRRPSFEHRTEALDLLVEKRVPGTAKILERIADSDREPEAHRAHARSLLLKQVATR